MSSLSMVSYQKVLRRRRGERMDREAAAPEGTRYGVPGSLLELLGVRLLRLRDFCTCVLYHISERETTIMTIHINYKYIIVDIKYR